MTDEKIHCRHCWVGCTGRPGEYGQYAMFHSDMNDAMWDHDKCPACAEAVLLWGIQEDLSGRRDG